ncbi:MAG: hypothetical protein KUG78_09065 [Kangiellaceae bacterium]|nr:hypothetical protein [Kangiellaceae bacterium]
MQIQLFKKLNLLSVTNIHSRTLKWLLIPLWLILFSNTSVGAVLVKEKLWPKNATLNVVFLDGEKSLHQLVKQIAPVWLAQTNLKFSFFEGFKQTPLSTHIRISFLSHSGSQLGNHQDFSSQFPTMNLHDLTKDSLGIDAAKRLILHEFGHALGFEHEYRSDFWPYGQDAITQIIKDCYPKMEGLGYTRQGAIDRCHKINKTINQDLAFMTAYDERSIMNYSISIKNLNGESKSIKPTFSLSLLDKYAMQRWYTTLE